jgi:predicted metalloendopeptidase
MKLRPSIFRLSMAIGATALLAGAQLHGAAFPPHKGKIQHQPTESQQTPPRPGFSVGKMDTAADPKRDFYHFAAGSWLDTIEIPKDQLGMSDLYLLAKQVSHQLQHILEQAAAKGADAPKGSPLQQVGDYYASGMDEEQLKTLGVSPLKPALERIEAIDSSSALAEALAQFLLVLGNDVMLMAAVVTDNQDRTVYAVYMADGSLGMGGSENYLSDDDKARTLRDAYLKYISSNLELIGVPVERAATEAKTILEMETRIAGKKLTPVEKKDPDKRFNKISFTEMESLLSNFDLRTYFKTLGLPTEGEVTVTQGRSLAELNRMLKEYPMAEIKSYLRWVLLRNTKDYLTPAFDQPSLAFMKARYGEIEMSPRAEQVTASVPALFGHPLSRLYVKEYFSDDTRKRVEEMVGQIKSLFRARLEANAWLSDSTRKAALEKIDHLPIDVGYPDEWIDYSSVDIRRDDYFGNVMRVNEFSARRNISRLGKPVKEDDFSSPGSTLPIDINAAYNPGRNKIEIAAAILQPPFFDPKLDAAVNYCTLGAVIGHEITHGFDSTGRLYDSVGNVRNWWTDQDVAGFVEQTGKLVAQADAYEAVPGVHLNGKLTVTENLADVGGVSLAYESLRIYLKEHPEADKVIDGYTPQQRCFIAWAQLWAGKDREGRLRQTAATDSHSPGSYRATAPSMHEAAFFDAFDIEPGDAMWRAEEDRVKIW